GGKWLRTDGGRSSSRAYGMPLSSTCLQFPSSTPELLDRRQGPLRRIQRGCLRNGIAEGAPMQIRTHAACAGLAALVLHAAHVLAQSSPSARGEAIAHKYCARCHAVGETGASPMGLAPPFRDLSKRYPIETLAEALAEGIVVRHPAMPRFTFEPSESNALLPYITGLKDRQ